MIAIGLTFVAALATVSANPLALVSVSSAPPHANEGLAHGPDRNGDPSQPPHAITIKNSCSYTIWPGLYTSGGSAPTPSTTGWQMNSGDTYQLSVPGGWNGRFWARTGCDFSNPALADCDTGYCVGGLQCTQPAVPPATLIEFNMDAPNDFYDVSNVDGSNVPVVVTPSDSSCTVASCPVDLNPICPSDLQVKNAAGTVVGCDSACLKYGSDQYCCTGADNTPQTCPPTNYSEFFKQNCPKAYSYAYDDGTSLFQCSKAAYTIDFCGSE